MAAAGIIYALDLGQRCGFAAGPAGAVPRSGAVQLKRKDEHRRVAFSNLIAWLNDEWSRDLPWLVATEAPLPLQAFKSLGNAAATVRVTYGLHGVIEGLCARFGVRHVEEHNQTVRKHFLGVPRLGDRAATKRAIIARCHLLKLLPRDCDDEDRADALSIHDWAAAHQGRTPPKALYMFGEVPG